MSQLDSARALATVVFTALLVIILLSSARTTYTLSAAVERPSARGGYALAACEARPVTPAPESALPRACPWPRSTPQSWSHAWPQSWPHSWPHWPHVSPRNISAAPEHALLD
jgi:hypothetical protein